MLRPANRPPEQGVEQRMARAEQFRVLRHSNFAGHAGQRLVEHERNVVLLRHSQPVLPGDFENCGRRATKLEDGEMLVVGDCSTGRQVGVFEESLNKAGLEPVFVRGITQFLRCPQIQLRGQGLFFLQFDQIVRPLLESALEAQ